MGSTAPRVDGATTAFGGRSLRRRWPRSRHVLLLAAALSVIGGTFGPSPMAGAQTPPPKPPVLDLRLLTVGAAGGPFTVALTQDLAPGTQITGRATTTAIGDAVKVDDIPSPLAAGAYHVGLDPKRLPNGPAGGRWDLRAADCDNRPLTIDPQTHLAAFTLAAGTTPTCTLTVAWTADAAPQAAAAAAADPPATAPQSAAAPAADPAPSAGDPTTTTAAEAPTTTTTTAAGTTTSTTAAESTTAPAGTAPPVNPAPLAA